MKVSLIRTEQTERTNNKTRTRRLRVYAPWFARCVSLIDWFQEVTKHSANKKKESQTNKQRQNKTTKNKGMNSKGKWRGTKKRTNTWKITEQRNELLKARPTERSPERTANWPTERPTNRPPDRLTKRQTESATDRPTDLPSNRLTDRPTEQTNNRGNCVLKEQTNKIPTDRTKKRDKKRVTDPMHGQKDTEKNEQMNESEQNK